MSDRITHIPQEYCPVLFALLTRLGTGLAFEGIHNVMEGTGNNIPDAKELGERQVKAGGMLMFLGNYIAKNGTLPEPEIMESLAAR